jgi:hypothetical protein
MCKGGASLPSAGKRTDRLPAALSETGQGAGGGVILAAWRVGRTRPSALAAPSMYHGRRAIPAANRHSVALFLKLIRNSNMSLKLTRIFAAALLASAAASVATAEPNETFETATVLAPGVMTVSQELRLPPDTVLGARGPLGGVTVVDDDGSPAGDGFASGLEGVPTNSGQIRFVVSGYGDEFFQGDHDQIGNIEVFVQPYDFFGDPLDLFSLVRLLQPGEVQEFSFSDPDWIGGAYDVYIDNLIDFEGLADVDFYRFTGLTPGATFTAETFDPSELGIDTMLGWFDESGGMIAKDDNGGDRPLSKLSGVVPASGDVVLAVTGGADEWFLGDHMMRGAYELKLTLAGGGLAADFNNDGQVNGLDLAAWKLAYGSTAGGDADDDLDTDGADFLIWQREFGSSAPSAAAAAAIPEPTSALLFAAGLGAIAIAALRQPPAPGRREQSR